MNCITTKFLADRASCLLASSGSITLLAVCSLTMAQSSSLYKNAQPLPEGAIAPLVEGSWTAVAPPQPRRFAKHDLIAIIVREETRYRHNGNAESEKKSDLVASLTQWIQLQNLDIKPGSEEQWPKKLDTSSQCSLYRDACRRFEK